MKLSKVFPSKYLKADDLEDRDWPVTIKRVIIEKIGQGEEQQEKLTVYFEELDKGIVCNKTNAITIEKLYGDETDAWVGKRITIYPNYDVQFKGEIVSAIRVRTKAPAAIAATGSIAQDTSSADRDALFNLVMDEIGGNIQEVASYMQALTGQDDIDKLSGMQVKAAIKRIQGGWKPGQDKKK